MANHYNNISYTDDGLLFRGIGHDLPVSANSSPSPAIDRILCVIMTPASVIVVVVVVVGMGKWYRTGLGFRYGRDGNIIAKILMPLVCG